MQSMVQYPRAFEFQALGQGLISENIYFLLLSTFNVECVKTYVAPEVSLVPGPLFSYLIPNLDEKFCSRSVFVGPTTVYVSLLKCQHLHKTRHTQVESILL